MAFNSPQAFIKGAKLEFLKMQQAKPYGSVFGKYIKSITSNANEEKFPIFVDNPGIREFVDRIGFGDFGMKYMTLTPSTFYNGTQIDYDTWEDSKPNIGNTIKEWVTSLKFKYDIFDDSKCEAALEANGNAYDGTAFFATSRPNLNTGTNTINNLISGTLSTAYTEATLAADYISARNALWAMKDADNLPFNPVINKLTALIPYHMEDVFQLVFGDRTKRIIDVGASAAKDNQYSGAITYVVNPYQSASNDDWYLICENNPFPPFAKIDRDKMKWFNLDDD